MRSIVQWLRQLGVALLIFLVTTYGVLVAGSLPRTVNVYVMRVEVGVSVDPASPHVARHGKDGGRRYLVTQTLEGEILRFRNDNTGWSWPPYFKFNASDLAEQGSLFAQSKPPAPVALRYYGFRLGSSASYPNVVNLTLVSPGPQPRSYFNWFVLAVHFLAFASLVHVRRRRRRRARNAEALESVSPND